MDIKEIMLQSEDTKAVSEFLLMMDKVQSYKEAQEKLSDLFREYKRTKERLVDIKSEILGVIESLKTNKVDNQDLISEILGEDEK